MYIYFEMFVAKSRMHLCSTYGAFICILAMPEHAYFKKTIIFLFFSFLSQFHLIETELYFRYVLLALTSFACMLKSCDVKLMIRDLNCVPQMTFCKRVYPYTLQTDTCQLQLLNLIQRSMLLDRPE